MAAIGCRAEVQRFLPVVEHTLKAGGTFTEAMIAAYTAVLCSPEFVTIDEKPAAHALDREVGRQVWEASLQMTGLTPDP